LRDTDRNRSQSGARSLLRAGETKPLVATLGSLVPLARPLSTVQRTALQVQLRKLLAWQRTLTRWPHAGRAPDATPFVTIYARGLLRGCFGCFEGDPGERLQRAFLRALEDSRYGGIRPEERGRLVVVVSYLRSVRPLDADAAEAAIEVGREGLVMTREGRPPGILLPSVARDRRAAPREMLTLLAKKCGVKDWRDARLSAVTTEEVVVRAGEPEVAIRSHDPRADAAAWMARLVGKDGAVSFAVDARRRHLLATGAMHHGRAASVVRALREHGGYSAIAQRAAAWLQESIEAGVAGQPVEGWPTDVAMVAGTLALAKIAGLPVDRALREAAEAPGLQRSAWHAAQVAVALGRDAPPSLWKACADHLRERPWAPWTLLAARARRDASVIEAAARAVIDSLRREPPHMGGCGGREVPETAVTALAVEALEGLPDRAARDAVERGRAFLIDRQLLAPKVPAELNIDLAHGAFAASPVVVDLLRCDVAGHAFSVLDRDRTRWTRAANRPHANRT
jgi:AMMECR1 domain-containing protein